MSLELAELTLDNDSFAQELTDTFEGNNDFERPAIRNSKRGKSKAITRANRRIKRTLRATRKARTAKRKLTKRIR